MSAIRTARLQYLEARGHTVGSKNPREQAVYLHGEAAELLIAVKAYHPDSIRGTDVEKEIADVVICADVLAEMFNTTVERCIALKTEADRGRG